MGHGRQVLRCEIEGCNNDVDWKRKIQDVHNKYQRERYHGDINYKLARLLRVRLRETVLNVYRDESAMVLVGCSTEDLIAHIQDQFDEDMHWGNMGKWHIDHIKPCASFDLTDPEQQRECFHYTNLQPLWGKDNISKGAKLDWKKE